VEIGCAVIAAAGADAGEDDAAADADDLAARAADDDALAAGEDFARLRFGARFLVVLTADFLAAEMARASTVAAGATAGADDDEDDAAMVVASPKSTAKASLVASGAAGFTRCSAGFLRLRLRARFWSRAADLVADAFRFLGMGVCVVAAARRREIAAGVRCC